MKRPGYLPELPILGGDNITFLEEPAESRSGLPDCHASAGYAWQREGRPDSSGWPFLR